jgi:peptidoglycan/LPS O-acetylase OafA/YrhL
MHYRSEIDGLRALALLPVMFFHAGFATFSGGFAGVDVFFVISGYLITTIILAEQQAGSFSLINFYERRVRRILPALFVVMAACLPLAWVILLPDDLKRFSQSLVAVSTLSSNVLFWKTSGYFDAAAELKPLLHTWSLAVEEQYYLLFPAVLVLGWRFGKRRMAVLLALAALLSLAVAQWASIRQPVAAFYLLPTRGWELLLGSLLAFYLSRSTAAKPARWLSLAGGAAGLLLILYGFFFFDQHTPFPGLYALAPAAGTALIILFARAGTPVGSLLGWRVLQGIGLISYSAYLWHQPLFAFARHASLGEPGKPLLTGLIGASLVLAYLSWKYVETPCRDRQRLSRRQVFSYALLGSALFIGAGLAGHVLKGVPARYSAEQRALLVQGDTNYKQTMLVYGLGKCFIDYDQGVEVLLAQRCAGAAPGAKKVVLFGDSEAAHLMAGIRDEFVPRGFAVEQWTGTSCRAVSYAGNTKRCSDFYNGFVRHVVPGLRPSDLVIVSSRWIGTLGDVGEDGLQQAVAGLFKTLAGTGARVIIVGNTPEFAMPPHHIMVSQGIQNQGTVMLASADFRTVNALLRRTTEQHGHVFFDPAPTLCDARNGLSCMFARDGQFYFVDRGHLSIIGSRQVIKGLLETPGLLRTPISE